MQSFWREVIFFGRLRLFYATKNTKLVKKIQITRTWNHRCILQQIQPKYIYIWGIRHEKSSQPYFSHVHSRHRRVERYSFKTS
eukprot:19988_4